MQDFSVVKVLTFNAGAKPKPRTRSGKILNAVSDRATISTQAAQVVVQQELMPVKTAGNLPADAGVVPGNEDKVNKLIAQVTQVAESGKSLQDQVAALAAAAIMYNDIKLASFKILSPSTSPTGRNANILKEIEQYVNMSGADLLSRQVYTADRYLDSKQQLYNCFNVTDPGLPGSYNPAPPIGNYYGMSFSDSDLENVAYGVILSFRVIDLLAGDALATIYIPGLDTGVPVQPFDPQQEFEVVLLFGKPRRSLSVSQNNVTGKLEASVSEDLRSFSAFFDGVFMEGPTVQDVASPTPADIANIAFLISTQNVRVQATLLVLNKEEAAPQVMMTRAGADFS